MFRPSSAAAVGQACLALPGPLLPENHLPDWLKDPRRGIHCGIKTAALDPFRGYANAIRDELPEAITVLDAFHVVKLGSAMVNELRCRVRDTLGHRGRKGDALFGIRRTLQVGAEHLTAKQCARLDAKLTLGDPDHEVPLAWQCYQKLRHMYHASPARGRELVNEVIGSFPVCPIPEISRLGRTLKQWKTAILAYFNTYGASKNSGSRSGSARRGYRALRS